MNVFTYVEISSWHFMSHLHTHLNCDVKSDLSNIIYKSCLRRNSSTFLSLDDPVQGRHRGKSDVLVRAGKGTYEHGGRSQHFLMFSRFCEASVLGSLNASVFRSLKMVICCLFSHSKLIFTILPNLYSLLYIIIYEESSHNII